MAIGVAQEYQRVFTGTKDQTSTGAVWFSYNRTERRVTCYYFYLWDAGSGAAFMKVCAYFPYPGKIWYTGTSGPNARRPDPAYLSGTCPTGSLPARTRPRWEEICDRLGPGQIRVFAERWRARLPLPFTRADRAERRFQNA